jgi:condensin complex subunit 1
MADEFNLQEELLSLASDPSLYHIPRELDISSLSESELDSHLSEAIEAIVNDPDSIVHSTPQTFDVFRSILKHSDSPAVGGAVMVKTLDTIISALNSHANAVMALVTGAGYAEEMDAPMVHKQPLEIWAFLLRWFVSTADKMAGKAPDAPAAGARGKAGKSRKPTRYSTAFVLDDYLTVILSASQKALRMPTSRIWRTTSERESFVSCFVKLAYQLCETESHLKSPEVRAGIYRVICLAVKFNGHAFGAQTTIIQNLTYFEHLSESMAELLEMLEKEFDYGQLGEEVLREVAAKTFAHNDVKGPRSFSRFLVRLAEGSPRVVQKQMPLLLAHLDSEVSSETHVRSHADSASFRLIPCVWPSSRSSACSLRTFRSRMKATRSRRRGRSSVSSSSSRSDTST